MASTFPLTSTRLVTVSRNDRRLDPQEKPDWNPCWDGCSSSCFSKCDTRLSLSTDSTMLELGSEIRVRIIVKSTNQQHCYVFLNINDNQLTMFKSLPRLLTTPFRLFLSRQLPSSPYLSYIFKHSSLITALYKSLDFHKWLKLCCHLTV